MSSSVIHFKGSKKRHYLQLCQKAADQADKRISCFFRGTAQQFRMPTNSLCVAPQLRQSSQDLWRAALMMKPGRTVVILASSRRSTWHAIFFVDSLSTTRKVVSATVPTDRFHVFSRPKFPTLKRFSNSPICPSRTSRLEQAQHLQKPKTEDLRLFNRPAMVDTSKSSA
jgi:hypothetical protein